jgi:hypothetical protein
MLLFASISTRATKTHRYLRHFKGGERYYLQVSPRRLQGEQSYLQLSRKRLQGNIAIGAFLRGSTQETPGEGVPEKSLQETTAIHEYPRGGYRETLLFAGLVKEATGEHCYFRVSETRLQWTTAILQVSERRTTGYLRVSQKRRERYRGTLSLASICREAIREYCYCEYLKEGYRRTLLFTSI